MLHPTSPKIHTTRRHPANIYVTAPAATARLSPLGLTPKCKSRVFIGLATIVTGQRFELVALADRHMLDTYESMLLQGANEELRLHHALSTGKRGRAMLRSQFLSDYTAELGKGGPYWLLNRLARLGPNHWWAYSQFTISVAGAAIPILRYFGL